jgi:deoxyribodipyrimidine photo-lyase
VGVPVQLVWLKRDLRLDDHAPLVAAASAGTTVLLYVAEPGWWGQPQHDGSQWRFVREGLVELRERLAERYGQRLIVRVGDAVEVLDDLRQRLGLAHLWSHEETGDGWTYARDRAVKRWSRVCGVPWTEIPASGIQRPNPGRDGWARRWEARVATPPLPAPSAVPSPTWPDDLEAGAIPDEVGVGLRPSTKDEALPGGADAAHDLLRSFLEVRGVGYRADMSSPVTGWSGCSRLAPHLTHGTVSLRSVLAATRVRRAEVRARLDDGEAIDRRWSGSLQSFESRLAWRDHFMQKLEDEPRLEHANVNPAFDGLRIEDPADWSDVEHARFAAWCDGRTGYPMVDACMRALHRGGWVNFRMRAMLVSFAAYDLWLHWRPCARFLSRHFLDYEPGIHVTQFQMQSGTTGINTLRIYNPVKQQLDQDPEGHFVRRYLPELARVPTEHLQRPSRMDAATQRAAGCVADVDYPSPIVDHDTAARDARRRVEAVKRAATTRAASREVAERHGSRKGARRRPPR